MFMRILFLIILYHLYQITAFEVKSSIRLKSQSYSLLAAKVNLPKLPDLKQIGFPGKC